MNGKKRAKRHMVQCFNEQRNSWFDHAGPFDTRAEAREVAEKVWQYKTRVVFVWEPVA